MGHYLSFFGVLGGQGICWLAVAGNSVPTTAMWIQWWTELFARIEEADKNPQIICRDDPPEAQMAHIGLTQLERVHTKASSKIKRLRRSVSQRRMPRETEKPPLTMIDEKPSDWTSTSKEDEDGHGMMKFENFLKGFRMQTTNWRLFFVKMVMEWWKLIFSDRFWKGFVHMKLRLQCVPRVVYTHSLVAHTFFRAQRAHCVLHTSHACHIHAWLKFMKKVLVPWVSLFSISPSLSHVSPSILAVPARSLKDHLPVRTVLAVLTCPESAGHAHLRTRTRSLAIWPSPPSTQVMSPTSSTTTWCSSTIRTTISPTFRKTTNENIRQFEEVAINNITVEISPACESAKYLGQTKNVSATGNSRDQKSNQGRLGIVLQIQNKSWHQNRTSYITDSACSIWWSHRWAAPLAHGRYQENMKEWYDRLKSKCFASWFKRKENTNRKHRSAKNEKDEEGEKENHGSSDEEIVQGSSSNTDCDQDSDVSFKKDTDEDIDTAEIEEEDRIDHMKRSTANAAERMKAAKIPCWIGTIRCFCFARFSWWFCSSNRRSRESMQSGNRC